MPVTDTPVPTGAPAVPLWRSPSARLVLLLVLLSAAVATALAQQPQRLLTEPWPTALTGGTAVAVFTAAYGLGTTAFVPRPVLNLGAGVLFGAQAGVAAALAGTVLGAGIAFGLGRFLGRDALRPLLRGRVLTAGDRQLSRHGFRTMLVLRLLPGVPFAASNYGAAVSRMRWAAFLAATALGSVPNTAAYVVAGSRADEPGSPAFLVAFGFIAIPGAVAAWCRRRRLPGPAAG